MQYMYVKSFRRLASQIFSNWQLSDTKIGAEAGIENSQCPHRAEDCIICYPSSCNYSVMQWVVEPSKPSINP